MSRIKLYNVFVAARLTQKFGANKSMYEKYGLDGHEGIDFVLENTPIIRSPISGIVTLDINKPRNNYGIYLAIDDVKQGVRVYLCHMKYTKVELNQRVIVGAFLGEMGNTGFTTGPHVHLMLCRIREGKIIDTDNGYKGMIDPLGPEVNWIPNIPPVWRQ